MTADILHAPQHQRLLRTVTQRQIRDAARLLDTQSQRGNQQADVLAAALHRAGLDLRAAEDRWLRTKWLLLALVLLVASAGSVLGALWYGVPR